MSKGIFTMGAEAVDPLLTEKGQQVVRVEATLKALRAVQREYDFELKKLKQLDPGIVQQRYSQHVAECQVCGRHNCSECCSQCECGDKHWNE